MFKLELADMEVVFLSIVMIKGPIRYNIIQILEKAAILNLIAILDIYVIYKNVQNVVKHH